MPVLDNPKWELAAQEVAKGKTQLEAIETAGYAPHDSNASRLIGNDKVKSRIRELQEHAAMATEITLQGQIEKLERLLLQAESHKQYAAAIAASREQSELSGLKVQRLESKRVDAFAAMSDEELEAYVNRKDSAGIAPDIAPASPARAPQSGNGHGDD
jgi:hypothetical protein